MAQQRLTEELKELEKNPRDGIVATIMDEDVFEWLARIAGPAGEPDYDLMLHMPKDYPSSPPKVAFVTKVDHPKVNKNGAIDIAILTQEGWREELTVAKLLEQIRDMLREG